MKAGSLLVLAPVCDNGDGCEGDDEDPDDDDPHVDKVKGEHLKKYDKIRIMVMRPIVG